MRPEVVTLGETMGLIAADEIGPLRRGHRMVFGIGGAESNVAIGLARLGHRAAWVGRVGDDEVGRLVLREMRGERVDVSHVVVDAAAPTGWMLKVRRTAASSEVSYARRGSAGSRLCPDDIPDGVVARARVLHITGITPALSESARAAIWHAVDIAIAAGVPVCLDVNHRPSLWSENTARTILRELVPRCDLIFASEPEAALVVGDEDPVEAARLLTKLGPRHAVIKRAEHGYVAMVDGQVLRGPAVRVPVVDPVGAGDAFVASYLASWLDGASSAQALHNANLAGAFVVAVPGDWEGLPTCAELAAFTDRTDAVQR